MKNIRRKVLSLIIIVALMTPLLVDITLATDIDNAGDTGEEGSLQEETESDDENVEETTISLDKTSVTIEVDESVAVTATVEPFSLADSVAWESSDESIATVDNGTIKGISEGSATIIASVDGVSVEVSVTVTKTEDEKVVATAISLSNSSVSLLKGNTTTLTVALTPSDAEDSITWTSSNTSVATVNSSGKITAVAKGSATITATADSGVKATCNVTVTTVASTKISLGYTHKGTTTTNVYIRKKTSTSSTKVVLVKKGKTVTMTGTSGSWYKVSYTSGSKTYTGYIKSKYITKKINITLIQDRTKTLSPTLTPSNSTDSVTYSSSNKKIATVNSSGKITAVGVGTATITAKTASGKTDYVIVKVKKKIPVTSISITSSVYTKVGSTYTISKTVKPSNYNDTLTWKSSNTSVATVNSSGKITAKGKGSCTITVTSTSGKTDTCKVYVTEKDTLSLNCKASYAADKYSRTTKEIYGTSVLGNNLEAYIIKGNGTNKKTIFIDFAVHGYEDQYAKDAKVLVSLANTLVLYYSKNPDLLGDYKMVIVPCANPDGTISGKNNYRQGVSNAFGRCTYKGYDMNRNFTNNKAIEAKYLKTLMNKYKMTVYLNVHGWENSVIGDSDIASIFINQVGLKTNKSGMYGASSGYIISYAKSTLGAKAALIELKSAGSVNATKFENALNKIMSSSKF